MRLRAHENWNLTGFNYEEKQGMYQPDEVLYFVNLPLEADKEGLSDVESIHDIRRAHHDLLRENFPEIVHTIWARTPVS